MRIDSTLKNSVCYGVERTKMATRSYHHVIVAGHGTKALAFVITVTEFPAHLNLVPFNRNHHSRNIYRVPRPLDWNFSNPWVPL